MVGIMAETGTETGTGTHIAPGILLVTLLTEEVGNVTGKESEIGHHATLEEAMVVIGLVLHSILPIDGDGSISTNREKQNCMITSISFAL